MSYRLGIIGAGTIARMHADAATAVGTTIAAFCDADPARSEREAARIDGAVALSRVEDLLAMKDVPAVVVALPNHLHAPVAVKALRAGKHVLLEKPMALDAAECDSIIAAMRETGRRVQLGFVSRCSPSAQTVEKLIGEGRLGRVYHARGQWHRRRGIPGLGNWFTTKSLSGGGVLIDLGVHVIDLVMHMTGRPIALRASGACTSTFGSPIAGYAFDEMWAGPPNPGGTFDVEDAASGLIRFEGGFTLDLSLSWAANVVEGPCSITLLGDRGGCTFEVWGDKIVVATEAGGRVADLAPRVPSADVWGAAWRRQHKLFADVVVRGAQPTATADEGRGVQAILDAIYRSSAEQREVEV